MRRRLLLILSAGLNLALVAVLFFSGHRKAHPPTNAAAASEVSGTNQPRTKVILRRQFFVWQELESTDYPTYIANLRAIACPEQTIRDIIIADVNQLYAKKRVMEVVTPDQQWWRSTPDTNVLRAAAEKIVALEQERRDLLTTLLGPNWQQSDPTTRQPAVALNGPILGELAPETAKAVEDIAAKSQQRAQAYIAQQKNAGAPLDPIELAKLDQQTRSELAQVLTPAQLQEYLLRYSQTATDLRNELAGVNVSPDEFRKLFTAGDSIEQQIPTAGPAQKTALERQLQTAIQGVLGPDRYQNYLMAQDPAYRDAVNVGQQYGATPGMIQNLYQLNQLTQDEMDRIRSDATLTSDEINAELAQVQQEQADARDQLLGLTPATPPEPPQPPPQYHPYSPGETIAQIADQNNTTPSAIQNANPNLDFNNLQRGALIRIPQAPSQ
jgi:LysM repeat protein